MREKYEIDEGLKKTLLDRFEDYKRLLWDLFGVPYDKQIDTIYEEELASRLAPRFNQDKDD